ncbi:hypothetical protein FRC20_004997 [Serendipita sp. 405]|nr:hypothetical protein FRC20_004997 [Serendipita sp. 405]
MNIKHQNKQLNFSKNNSSVEGRSATSISPAGLPSLNRELSYPPLHHILLKPEVQLGMSKFKKWLDWRPGKKSPSFVVHSVTQTSEPASTSTVISAPTPPPSQPSSPSNVSVWLLPAQSSPENQVLSSIIGHLANKYGNYAYHPHVTLALLPPSFPPAIIERVLNEMKSKLFEERVVFEALHPGQTGILVYGRREYSSTGAPAGLMALQQVFHDRLDEELKVALERGDEAVVNLGYTEVRNIVPMFPHFSIAYTPAGQAEGVAELQQMGFYTLTPAHQGESGTAKTPGDVDALNAGEGMTLGGYRGYQVGALFAAYCGGLRPEEWRIFLRVE